MGPELGAALRGEKGQRKVERERTETKRDPEPEPDAVIKDHITANPFWLGNTLLDQMSWTHKSFTVMILKFNNDLIFFFAANVEDVLYACTWSLHAPVVVGVDTDVLLLGAKGELAALQGFQLVVGLQVRPAPHPAVDDMRQTFPVGHLQPPVQRPRNRHARA